jgi:hypothetical protein
MSKRDEQLARMKGLMTYGMVSENKKTPVKDSIEGPDGNVYAIIREGAKYYIKSTPKGSALVTESFDYIGGFMNKKANEFTSYNQASKNLELKVRSLNEAYGVNKTVEMLNPEKKETLMVEMTDAMKASLARYRQIMNNAAGIMNESAAISASNTGVPEAPKTTGFSAKLGEPFTDTAEAKLDQDLKATANDPEKQSEPFGDNKKAEEYKDAQYVPDGSVANKKPSGGKVVRVNENNEYEETMFYCADDNKAIFGKGFDITLSYGDAKGEGSYNACTQTLVGCYITSYRQAFDTSGEPILDMYTFIAKDLLIVDNGSTEIVETDPVPEYDSLEPPTGTGGKEEAEPYVIANNRITKEADELYAYCKDHPETLGILIDPTYDYIDGKSRISIFIMPYNDIELLIDRITIELTDIGLSGSYSFTLDKRIDEWNFYYELIGTNIQTGKHIKTLFEEGTVTSLECCVSIDCNDRTNTFNIRQYATLLHSGTIDTNYN